MEKQKYHGSFVLKLQLVGLRRKQSFFLALSCKLLFSHCLVVQRLFTSLPLRLPRVCSEKSYHTYLNIFTDGSTQSNSEFIGVGIYSPEFDNGYQYTVTYISHGPSPCPSSPVMFWLPMPFSNLPPDAPRPLPAATPISQAITSFPFLAHLPTCTSFSNQPLIIYISPDPLLFCQIVMFLQTYRQYFFGHIPCMCNVSLDLPALFLDSLPLLFLLYLVYLPYSLPACLPTSEPSLKYLVNCICSASSLSAFGSTLHHPLTE